MLSGFWAASPAQAVTSGTTPTTYTGTVSLDSTGTVDSGAVVTLSGTYRCSGPSPYAVVNSSVGNRVAIGTPAVCDGAEHTWVSHGRPNPGPLVRVGQAEAATRLEVWVAGSNGTPRVVTFAIDRKIVDIQAAAG